METLDQLITKFKEYKEELEKNSLLHDTVDGFMGSLKALPKGSAERGKLITQHMNHGPFLTALSSHPQGKQMHAMLTGHLNSAANAGFKPGKTQVMAKNDETDIVDDLEKHYVSPFVTHGRSKPVAPAAKPEGKLSLVKPKLTGSDKIAAVSKEPIQSMNAKVSKPAAAPKLTGMDRIKAESQKPIEAMNAKVKKDEDEEKDDDMEKGLFSPKTDKPSFTPSFKGHKDALGVGSQTNAKGVTTERSFDPLKQQTSQKKFINMPFEKTVNGSYSTPANGDMGKGEKLSLNKGGQWSLEKDGLQDAIKNLKSSTKVTSAMNTLRAGPAPVAKEETCKDEEG